MEERGSSATDPPRIARNSVCLLFKRDIPCPRRLWYKQEPECAQIVLDWLVELCGLPDAFSSKSDLGGGVLQPTASEASLVAILGARERALTQHPGAEALLVAYSSDQVRILLSNLMLQLVVWGRGLREGGIVSAQQNRGRRTAVSQAQMAPISRL